MNCAKVLTDEEYSREPLLRQLGILYWIVSGSYSARELSQAFRISDREFKREIASLKHFGAEVRAVKGKNGFRWQCDNAEVVMPTVDAWYKRGLDRLQEERANGLIDGGQHRLPV